MVIAKLICQTIPFTGVLPSKGRSMHSSSFESAVVFCMFMQRNFSTSLDGLENRQTVSLRLRDFEWVAELIKKQCFSFTLCWNHPGPNMQKAGERYWKAEAASDHWCVSAEWQGVAWNGHFPACVHHVWLLEVYRKNLISFLSAALHRELLWYLKCIIVDDIRIYSYYSESQVAQDNVASAVRKSTAEKVSPGLGRKDWGFETESPARRSPFVHIFSLGSIELSSKHIRRVSQNMLMPTCINHPVYVSESGQFNGLTVVDEFCAHPSKAESKRFLEANHLWKLYAEEVYPLTYPQINRA